MDIQETAIDHVRQAVTDAAAMISAIDDPAELDKAAVGFGTYLREEATAAARAIRQVSVQRQREQGQTLAQIGERLGLKPSHVREIGIGRSGGSADKKERAGRAGRE